MTFSPDEKVTWKAVDQFNQATTDIVLPKMLQGSTWLGAITDTTVPAPVVDEVRSLTGTTRTIFQHMNEAGDLLQVCTNVASRPKGGLRSPCPF